MDWFNTCKPTLLFHEHCSIKAIHCNQELDELRLLDLCFDFLILRPLSLRSLRGDLLLLSLLGLRLCFLLFFFGRSSEELLRLRRSLSRSFSRYSRSIWHQIYLCFHGNSWQSDQFFHKHNKLHSCCCWHGPHQVPSVSWNCPAVPPWSFSRWWVYCSICFKWWILSDSLRCVFSFFVLDEGEGVLVVIAPLDHNWVQLAVFRKHGKKLWFKLGGLDLYERIWTSISRLVANILWGVGRY